MIKAEITGSSKSSIMTTTYSAYRFDNAIVRSPARSVVAGLRAGKGENPTYDGVKAEHQAYIKALTNAGVTVQILDPLDEFPDSIFVEDPALVFTQGAILLNLGAPSRRGESAVIETVLKHHFPVVQALSGGRVEGGDALYTCQGVMIGLSERTNQEGAEALAICLDKFGLESRIVETPENVLHFKSDCSLLDDDLILTTQRLAKSGVFNGFNILTTPEGEEGAANALRINDVIFLAKGYPKTKSMLEDAGLNISLLDTTQISKIDAGLSCMSLRWSST